MHCTVREAKQRLTSREYTEYVAFYQQFPYDYGFAMIAALIQNIMRDKDSKPVTVADFMPADFVINEEQDEDDDPNAAMWQNLRRLGGTADHG